MSIISFFPKFEQFERINTDVNINSKKKYFYPDKQCIVQMASAEMLFKYLLCVFFLPSFLNYLLSTGHCIPIMCACVIWGGKWIELGSKCAIAWCTWFVCDWQWMLQLIFFRSCFENPFEAFFFLPAWSIDACVSSDTRQIKKYRIQWFCLPHKYKQRTTKWSKWRRLLLMPLAFDNSEMDEFFQTILFCEMKRIVSFEIKTH